MGKQKRQAKMAKDSSATLDTTANSSTAVSPTTTTALAKDPTIGYKIRVLIYDFLHAQKNPDSARRIDSTTDEHYISLPYFDMDEAAMIKAAIVDTKTDFTIEFGDAVRGEEDEQCASMEGMAFENAVHSLLNSFIDKRRASGDARPCGPHHMAPMYGWIFGIGLKEVEDERFLSRLRRSGI
jgi:hypothetical protein